MIDLRLGDCREVMASMASDSIDAVVTDPPYGLSFMGKGWDHGVPGMEFWTEALRVSKPGAHLLAFGGTRTHHRLMVAIEDAGWEIRDCMMWLYGSGFPKSLDVSKAIDKAAGAEREVIGVRSYPTQPNGRSNMDQGYRPGETESGSVGNFVTAPATEAARQWDGWGTALKPAYESIIVARKPLPEDGEQGRILASLTRLEARLCLLLSDAFTAASPSTSSLDVPRLLAIARWSADERQRTRAALFEAMDTSQSDKATTSCWNTVRSWRSTLADAWSQGSTSTTETKSSTTTDWKTLWFCLSAITPENIIQAQTNQPGCWWNASPATRYFAAVVANIESTLTLSALGPAIARVREACPGEVDEGLSPNWEPVIVARKPLVGTVADNVLRYGTGALNIKGGRIGGGEPRDINGYPTVVAKFGIVDSDGDRSRVGHEYASRVTTEGRWPANVILDEEAGALLDAQTGGLPGGTPRLTNDPTRGVTSFGSGKGHEGFGDQGGAASRFFYTAKASRSERTADGFVDNRHPTVKPTDLMEYLVRLVTPPGGTVLDPFMGSGSTGVAAEPLGFGFVGIEQDPDSFETAKRRLSRPYARSLFGRATG